MNITLSDIRLSKYQFPIIFSFLTGCCEKKYHTDSRVVRFNRERIMSLSWMIFFFFAFFKYGSFSIEVSHVALVAVLILRGPLPAESSWGKRLRAVGLRAGTRMCPYFILRQHLTLLPSCKAGGC